MCFFTCQQFGQSSPGLDCFNCLFGDCFLQQDANFNDSLIQVSGGYDPEAQLYRWAELTDRISQHCHEESDLKDYTEALMESALQLAKVMLKIVVLSTTCLFIELNYVSTPPGLPHSLQKQNHMSS